MIHFRFLNDLNQFVPSVYFFEIILEVLIICIIGYCLITVRTKEIEKH